MTKYEIEIERTPESVVSAIRYAEWELGDNFLEYRDIFPDSSELMKFAHLRKYINKDKYEFWKQGFEDNELGAEESFEVIFGEDPEFEPYCIAYYQESESSNESDYADGYNHQYSRALMVYGELICSKEEYYNLFVKELTSREGNLKYLDVIIK